MKYKRRSSSDKKKQSMNTTKGDKPTYKKKKTELNPQKQQLTDRESKHAHQEHRERVLRRSACKHHFLESTTFHQQLFVCFEFVYHFLA